MDLIKLLGKREPGKGLEAVPAFYAKSHAPFVYQGQPLTTVDVGHGYFYVLPPTVAATTPEEHEALVQTAAAHAQKKAAPAPVDTVAAPETAAEPKKGK